MVLLPVATASPATLAQRLLPPPLAAAPLAPGSTRIARVVDARFERSGAGAYAPAGPLPPSPATFEVPFDAALQAFFGFFAPGQADSTPLLLRVTGLDVAEERGSLARAGLVADLYTPQPDSSYRLLRHLSLYQEQGSAIGLGHPPHAANVGQLLLQAAQLARDPTAWLPAGPVQPAAYVRTPAPYPAEQLPILTATVLRPGLYHSLPEFWNNDPAEPGQPDLDQRPYTGTEWAGELEVKAYRRTSDGRRAPATDVWGLCDGHDLYIRRGGTFYRLRREDAHFAFTGVVGEGAALHAAHNVLGTAALLYSGVGSFSNTPERPAPMTLHPLTGTVQLAESPGAAPAPLASRPTQLYIYRPKAAKGAAVQVRLPGPEPVRALPAGEYLAYQVPADQPVQVCLLPADGGPEACQALTPAPEQTTYLEYRPGQPLQLMPAKAGAAALERLVR